MYFQWEWPSNQDNISIYFSRIYLDLFNEIYCGQVNCLSWQMINNKFVYLPLIIKSYDDNYKEAFSALYSCFAAIDFKFSAEQAFFSLGIFTVITFLKIPLKFT